MTIRMPDKLSFHHTGIACADLKTERTAFRTLGFVEEGTVFHDPLQKILGQFMTHGSMRIELLEPSEPDSPLHGYLKRGIKMYHQAFETPDLRASISEAIQSGAHLVVTPCPAIAFGGREIAFLMLRTTMLVELIQSEAN
jgi:methylmalonyl-CoA/ethylmalonyl-CoA epimerase